ncbi:hypothetical protein [Streptomyces sp. NPDC060022]|uniref:hypothetical protein n=1 Tax=Streptomyces sp. NPDC060022 TaxID=3347039 RepID=UPI0036B10FFC
MRRTGEGVEFRVGTAQMAVPLVLGMASATGLLCLGLRWTADPMTAAELRDCAYAAGVGVLGALALTRSTGVRLTHEHLVAISPFGRRERRIRWADVSGIDVRRTFGVTRVNISLVTGERLTLSAPMSFLDRRFDSRVGELNRWWEAHRH